jgi:hypothetical protein
MDEKLKMLKADIRRLERTVLGNQELLRTAALRELDLKPGKVIPLPEEQNPDNWASRAVEMKCRTCMAFVPKAPASIGRCRMNAPTMKGFPAVYQDDWCMAHKLDEEKI